MSEASATCRTLLIGGSEASRAWLDGLIAGSEIVLDGVVGPEEAIASLALRAPDLIVVDADGDPLALAQVCGLIKANPATVLLPLLAIARSNRQRVPAFEASVDDFLSHEVRREEFLVRVRALLRASAARRRLAAEQLAEEVQRRELIRATFRRYISPKLADQILASEDLRGAMLAGVQKRAWAAVMFADMRGFTGISERLEPAEVVEVLNEFFALLTDITFEYDGTVFNMAGDSLMVGFGVPVPQSDGAVRAILTGQRMLQDFAALAERWRGRYQVETGLGVGINVGEVIAGNIGSPAYMNYTIVGDAVNVAARLGQRARAGEMLFSDAVKRALDAQGMDIAAMALPSLVLRGRSTPIDLFCVPFAGERSDLRPH